MRQRSRAESLRSGPVNAARFVAPPIFPSEQISVAGRVLIRIVKSLPAPVMDGFDVSAYRIPGVYDAEGRTANYLVVAGYAERLDEALTEPGRTPKPRRRGR